MQFVVDGNVFSVTPKTGFNKKMQKIMIKAPLLDVGYNDVRNNNRGSLKIDPLKECVGSNLIWMQLDHYSFIYFDLSLSYFVYCSLI